MNREKAFLEELSKLVNEYGMALQPVEINEEVELVAVLYKGHYQKDDLWVIWGEDE
jgi:hypothetical protein